MKNLEKVKQKEAKQLAYWEKVRDKKTMPGIMVISLILCGMIRLVDDFASSISGSIQSALAAEFFPHLELAEAVGLAGSLGSFLILFSIVAVFLVILADTYGRKRLLILSIFGIGAGMLICSWSPNYATYIVGGALITLFVSTDFHGLYIMEVAPDDKRSLFGAVASIIGYSGGMLVAVGRMAFTTDDGTIQWRLIYLIPAIIAVLLGVLTTFFSSEPEVYVERRIAMLSTPLEERIAKEKEQKGKQVGLKYAFKYIFSHKLTRVMVFAGFFQSAAIMAFTGYYESIMTEAWGTSLEATNMISQAIFIAPVGAAVSAIIIGWIGDKYGRKPSCVFASVTAFTLLFVFITATRQQWNAYIVGLIYGLEMGAFWGYGNNVGLAKNEVVPTEIRATTSTAIGLMTLPVTILSGVVISVLVAITGAIGTTCLIWGAVCLGCSMVIYTIWGKETKGADLNNVVSD